jgi:maleylpyruvate isomerase
LASSDEKARLELRRRLGSGARFDSENAPAEELLLARRGTAYFARKLNELTDVELDAPCLIEGWTRRHLIARVSYHARAISRLMDWAATGYCNPMYASLQDRDQEITLGSTLPPRALRHLFQHTEVHLNVMWRDLPSNAWNAMVEDEYGNPLTARETVNLRADEVWHSAILLGNGGRLNDIPSELRREPA